jgi:hypothetical protein
MEAGLADHVWSVEELIALLPEAQAKKRGAYKKKVGVRRSLCREQMLVQVQPTNRNAEIGVV